MHINRQSWRFLYLFQVNIQSVLSNVFFCFIVQGVSENFYLCWVTNQNMRGEVHNFFLIDLIQFKDAFIHLNRKDSFGLANIHLNGLVKKIMREDILAILIDFYIRKQNLLMKHIIDKPSIPKIFGCNIFSHWRWESFGWYKVDLKLLQQKYRQFFHKTNDGFEPSSNLIIITDQSKRHFVLIKKFVVSNFKIFKKLVNWIHIFFVLKVLEFDLGNLALRILEKFHLMVMINYFSKLLKFVFRIFSF